jgi:predicted glycoside hydrolase/deacetylase ChbG (UPF0249 family)
MSVSEMRQLVVHHDDLGASHSANQAFVELSDMGVVTSGSVMVPCPWFPEMAAICRERPDLDVGVHLTLNAEFAGFRWRPLTGISANGLTDGDGFMWRRVQDARHADLAAVEAELRLQVDTALAAGIDVTHLDSHMGTVTLPEYVEIYLRLGEEYRLPVVFARDVGDITASGPAYDAIVERLVARGNPDFQRFICTPFGNLAPDATTYAAIFDQALPGLNWAAFHFTAPGDIELYADDAPTRLAEYALFRSGRAQELLDTAGIELVGMRGFRDAMRASPAR